MGQGSSLRLNSIFSSEVARLQSRPYHGHDHHATTTSTPPSLSSKISSFTPGKSLLALLFIHGIQYSPLLLSKIPKVRRLALIETLRFNSSLERFQHQIQQQQHTTTGISSSSSVKQNKNVRRNKQGRNRSRRRSNRGGQRRKKRAEDTTQGGDSSNIKTTNQNYQDHPQYQLEKHILTIVMENVNTSPFISQEEFQHAVLDVIQSISSINGVDSNNIAESILDGNWNSLLEAIFELSQKFVEGDINHGEGDDSVQVEPQQERDTQRDVQSFRSMVIEMLTTSKKISNMDLNRRRELSRRIHLAPTIQDILQSSMDYLNTSRILTDASLRDEIKTLSFEQGRFDLLLLGKFFDCEEYSRRRPRRKVNDEADDASSNGEDASMIVINESTVLLDDAEEDPDNVEALEECAICLDYINQSQKTGLVCNHAFCADCIEMWLSHHSTCPTCHHPISQMRQGQAHQSHTGHPISRRSKQQKKRLRHNVNTVTPGVGYMIGFGIIGLRYYFAVFFLSCCLLSITWLIFNPGLLLVICFYAPLFVYFLIKMIIILVRYAALTNLVVVFRKEEFFLMSLMSLMVLTLLMLLILLLHQHYGTNDNNQAENN